MAGSLSIKKGDLVRVLRGADKGVEGRVIAVHAERSRVVVEGVNRVKRHTKVVQQGGRGGTTGGIVTQEAPVHVSNVMLLADHEGEKRPTRLGSRRDDVEKQRSDGTTYAAKRSVRVSRRTGEEI